MNEVLDRARLVKVGGCHRAMKNNKVNDMLHEDKELCFLMGLPSMPSEKWLRFSGGHYVSLSVK